jgi:hypothetical protein
MSPQDKPQKTYKREIAVVLLAYLMYLGFVDNYRVLEVVVWPFMVYVLAAFGFDSYNKQTLKSSSHDRFDR